MQTMCVLEVVLLESFSTSTYSRLQQLCIRQHTASQKKASPYRLWCCSPMQMLASCHSCPEPRWQTTTHRLLCFHCLRWTDAQEAAHNSDAPGNSSSGWTHSTHVTFNTSECDIYSPELSASELRETLWHSSYHYKSLYCAQLKL